MPILRDWYISLNKKPDKKNLFIRVSSFLMCFLAIIIWAITESNALGFLVPVSLMIMLLLMISSVVNWIGKKAPWYEFTSYLLTLLLLVFISFVQFARHWNHGAPRNWNSRSVSSADSTKKVFQKP